MADLTLVVTPKVAQVVTLQPLVSQVIKIPGQQGPAGPPGPTGPAGSQYLTYTAGATLSGHRFITTDASGNAIYADNTIAAHAQKVIGITTGAVANGATAQVQNGGDLTDPSFTFTPGQTLWLGTNGQILTVAPTTGFVLVVGYAETATKILIHIGQPIILI